MLKDRYMSCIKICSPVVENLRGAHFKFLDLPSGELAVEEDESLERLSYVGRYQEYPMLNLIKSNILSFVCLLIVPF